MLFTSDEHSEYLCLPCLLCVCSLRHLENTISERKQELEKLEAAIQDKKKQLGEVEQEIVRVRALSGPVPLCELREL